MVIVCPKCKTKLNIPDEKIKPEGSKFKCPKCTVVLKVNKPIAPAAVRALDKTKVIVAHENPSVVEAAMNAITPNGMVCLFSGEGVDMMTKTLKSLPHIAIVDIALPRINGFEVARRLRARKETKDMKIILISSPADKARQRKRPPETYGVDQYIDDGDVGAKLWDTIQVALGLKTPEPEAPPPQPAAAAQPAAASAAAVAAAATAGRRDEGLEKARRLARTVFADIELYSPEKVKESIRANNFHAVFADELREGLKHYQNRIPAETRQKGNYFQEELDEFIAKKRRALNI